MLPVVAFALPGEPLVENPSFEAWDGDLPVGWATHDGAWTGDPEVVSGVGPGAIGRTADVSDAQLAEWGLTRESWAVLQAEQRDAFFGSVGSGSYRVELDGATHESFGGEPFVIASLQKTDDVGVHADRMRLVRAYVAAFVDRFVGGVPGTLLDEEPEPGVRIARWPAE